jgi:C1A family cysteine protease
MTETALPNPETKIKRHYGRIKDKPHTLTPHTFAVQKFISAVRHLDLRNTYKIPVYDQGELGSCTANGINFLYEFDQFKQHEKSPFVPSRLFTYYNERKLTPENLNVDSGASISDGVTVLSTVGVIPESLWPYDISKFADQPPLTCYNQCVNHKAITYRPIRQNLNQMKQALLSGFPICFGCTVFESFESEEVARTGLVPMPKRGEEEMGGHCMVIVGFDDDKHLWIVRNSWGNWGDAGYCYMPYDYLTNSRLADDFWIITTVRDL